VKARVDEVPGEIADEDEGGGSMEDAANGVGVGPSCDEADESDFPGEDRQAGEDEDDERGREQAVLPSLREVHPDEDLVVGDEDGGVDDRCAHSALPVRRRSTAT
jgi:hypothetical protein